MTDLWGTGRRNKSYKDEPSDINEVDGSGTVSLASKTLKRRSYFFLHGFSSDICT